MKRQESKLATQEWGNRFLLGVSGGGVKFLSASYFGPEVEGSDIKRPELQLATQG